VPAKPHHDVPPYRLIVLPWLKPIGQRFIIPTWLAITIWRWIFAWRQLDDAELAHELTHVKQWRANGPILYIWRYMSESSRAKKAGKDRYRDNKFEVEAYAAEDAVRKHERAEPG
jgi:hypothetical protein